MKTKKKRRNKERNGREYSFVPLSLTVRNPCPGQRTRTRKFSIEKARSNNFDVLRELVLIRSTLIAFPSPTWRLLFSPTCSFPDRFSLILSPHSTLLFPFSPSFLPPFFLILDKKRLLISRCINLLVEYHRFAPRTLSLLLDDRGLDEIFVGSRWKTWSLRKWRGRRERISFVRLSGKLLFRILYGSSTRRLDFQRNNTLELNYRI